MDADLSHHPLWNPDPVLLRAGALVVRWYSVCLFLAFPVGYAVWHWQMRRGGHGLVPVSRFLVWGAIGVLAGGRLFHCLFYETDFYLSHPWAILDLRRGGLASHGSAAGLIAALLLYARRYEYSFVEVADRFAMAAMAGGFWVRIGNFFNAEAVGREWYGPWAIRFGPFAARSQAEWERVHGSLGWTAEPLPRHPAQLYEAAGILAIALVLLAVDRRLGERRPRGLLAAVVGILYFSLRFLAEYTKEFEGFGALAPDPVARVIRIEATADLTRGQWLSLPFFFAFLTLGIASLRRPRPAAAPSRFDAEPETS